jgi:hypothetical protein
LAIAANANTTANVDTIQWRAGFDAIDGARISSTPPPIHANMLDKPLPKPPQEEILGELIRIANAPL